MMEEAEQKNSATTDLTLTLTLTRPPPPPPPPAITLRPFNSSDSDIDALITLAGDDRATRFLRRGPFSDRDSATRFLHSHVLPHPWYRAICLPGGFPVGSIFLRPERPRVVSLGYRIAGEFWGRGIGTEAVKMAAAAAFEGWAELERVEAMADAENLGSQRVLEKAGFVREAVLRRYLVFKEEVRDMVLFSFVL